MYDANYRPAAAKQLRKLGPRSRERVLHTVEILREHPRPPKAIKMAGRDNQWRVRTGDYRIIYQIHDDELLILVIKIGHRRDVYKS